MKTAHNVPQISFIQTNFDKQSNTIEINLNFCLWLNQAIEEYLFSHRRLLPTIDVHSPSGKVCGFQFPKYEGSNIVYSNKKGVKLILTFK